MHAQSLDRRQFLKQGTLLAGLAAAGRLPLLTAADGTGIDAVTGPASVKPIRPYLAGFVPVDHRPGRQRDYTLTYDIVHWTWGSGRPTTRKTLNDVAGRLIVKRRRRPDAVAYEVAQQTHFGGLTNFLKAQLTCALDEFDTLRSWRIRTHSADAAGATVPLSQLDETGENRAGHIRLSHGQHEQILSASRPVVSQWSLLGYLMQHPPRTEPVSFDLLQDLSLFKPNQTLVFDGTVDVPVKGGRKVTLNSYAQTGEGILPTHYLLDAQGRPQLVTASLVSWALQSIGD